MSLKNRVTRSIANRFSVIILSIFFIVTFSGCSVNYSMSGISTEAKTISFAEFYNNVDLGPANMGQTFTNSIKNYFIQNSSLTVVAEEGELQMEGEISGFTITPIAPVSTGNPQDITQASQQRVTITVKATFINTLKDDMSFKDKTFSFYKDFPNEVNIIDVQDQYTKQIFDRIINDIFNASVANW